MFSEINLVIELIFLKNFFRSVESCARLLLSTKKNQKMLILTFEANIPSAALYFQIALFLQLSYYILVCITTVPVETTFKVVVLAQ